MASSSSSSPPVGSLSKSSLYHCDFCRRDLSSGLRIRCATCPDFDLCVECFAAGHQVPPHLNTHPYRVVEVVKTPIFTPDWGADEELLLLEGIETFGFGNWGDIADHVGTKTKMECESHYEAVYIATEDLVPDSQRTIFDENGKQREKLIDIPMVAAPPPPVPLPPMMINKPKPRSGLGHLVGYSPNRGDFDTEYDNDAELILSDMEFKAEDTKWERELKLKVLEIYNSKLDARAERKKFILERGLLERKEKKRTKDEREVYNNMRVFARFHSPEEHEQFIQGILNEQRLRRRIEQLQQHRLNGIKTLAEAELFEAEKRRREAQSAALKKKEGGVPSHDGPSAGSSHSKKRPLTGAAAASAAANATHPNGTTETLEDKEKEKDKHRKLEHPIAALSSPSSSFSIDGCDSVELLSDKEKFLCTTLQLLPVHYLTIKERLVRECAVRGFLKEGQAKQLIKIDINKTNKLFDFFISVGWINNGERTERPATSGKTPQIHPNAQTLQQVKMET